MKPLLISVLLFNALAFEVHAAGEEAGEASAKPERERGPDGPRSDRGFRPNPRHGRESWTTSDLDGDGKISQDEFSRMPRISDLPEEKRNGLFARLDTNGDGFLDGEELGRVRRPGGPGPHRGMRRIWQLDLDKSGGVSFEEFEKSEFFKKLPPGKRREIFDRLDTNGDGQLNPDDRPQPPQGRRGGRPAHAHGFFPEFDTDRDNRLSFEEFRKMPPASGLGEDEQEDRFEAMDKDGDRFLSREEFTPPRGEGRSGGREKREE